MSGMNLSLWKIPEYWTLIQHSESVEFWLDSAFLKTRSYKYIDENLVDYIVEQANGCFNEAMLRAFSFRQLRKQILLEVRATSLPQASANDDWFDVPGGAA